MENIEPFTLVARDYRALRSVAWNPAPGLNVLVGPNGSGKTTVLSALKFLRTLFSYGHESALGVVKGVHLRRRGAAAEAPVHFEIQVGEIRWTLDLPVDARGLVSTYGESLTRGDEAVLRATMYQEEWTYEGKRRKFPEGRCCARFVWDHAEPEWMIPLVDCLRQIRVYDTYRLDLVRGPTREDERRTYLHPTGANLWTVLSHWKTSPRRFNHQFAWVIEAMRSAFPDVVRDLEFDGVTPHGMIFPPDASSPDDAVPALLEADGVLTGFLHLTAVAGAARGSVLAFDEIENQLHPYAIRSILNSMRERAEENELTILMTTHSPVVLNAFEGQEDQVYVMERGQETLPVALTELRDPVWLTSFTLGRRYERLDFGAPGITQG